MAPDVRGLIAEHLVRILDWLRGEVKTDLEWANHAESVRYYLSVVKAAAGNRTDVGERFALAIPDLEVMLKAMRLRSWRDAFDAGIVALEMLQKDRLG